LVTNSLLSTERQPEKIVVRGVNWLGDAIMSIPALLRLREAKPHAHLALLTTDKLSDLWLHHPAINEVIPFSKAEGVGSIANGLRNRGIHTALIFPNSFRSAFEPWLAGVPNRIGYIGNGRSPFLSQKVPRRLEESRMRKRSVFEIKRLVAQSSEKPRDSYPSSAHHVHDYLQLSGALGAKTEPVEPRIHVTPGELENFRTNFQLPYSKELLIGLNPGAEYGPAKRWPLERFIETVRQFRKVVPATFLIFGAKGDIVLANEIESPLRSRDSKIVNAAGQTTLRELCAGLALCDLLLTNDTGPMHLAAAVGTRVIVPFGSTSPELTGPGLPGLSRHQLILGQAPCAPCFLRECPVDFRCMKSIAVEQIVNAMKSATQKSP